MKFMKTDSRWKDRASATLVSGIISTFFILLVTGFAIDISKNSYLKSEFASRAQHSVDISSKDMNARGGMKDTTPASLVTTYNTTFGDDSTEAFKSPGCQVQEATLWDGSVGEVTLPYIVIKMDTDRARGVESDLVYVSEGGAPPVQVSGTFDPSATYRVLNAEVTDYSQNFFLGMFGMGCQKFSPSVSAIAFGSNEDL